MMNPVEAPENRPSVMSAQDLLRPAPMIAAVGPGRRCFVKNNAFKANLAQVRTEHLRHPRSTFRPLIPKYQHLPRLHLSPRQRRVKVIQRIEALRHALQSNPHQHHSISPSDPPEVRMKTHLEHSPLLPRQLRHRRPRAQIPPQDRQMSRLLDRVFHRPKHVPHQHIPPRAVARQRPLDTLHRRTTKVERRDAEIG